ncbi:PREDICTED: terminal [Prunus dulcis]|uniref:PREDICTED: terminal n=2 Tax=Prunus dulcis TaxID=3755 RepID=A0A5E4FST5_PRUDU|nr:PREDICTED: terminal [Prunus dulcis]
MAFLDTHCAMENKKYEKLGGEGGGDNSTLISAYDFLYLPIDFQTGFNKGYAFVNFTSPEAVWKFYKAADSQAWELFHSTKIRQIAYAKIQGKKRLVRHFETMGFPCESEDVLPLSFEPPRDGLRRQVLRTTVGKLIFREEEKSQ